MIFDRNSLNEDDKLCFIIDETIKGCWNAETEFTSVEYNVSEGEHVFEWEYECQAPCNGNAWIDDVFIPVVFGTDIVTQSN